jgi:hypothetical protein
MLTGNDQQPLSYDVRLPATPSRLLCQNSRIDRNAFEEIIQA